MHDSGGRVDEALIGARNARGEWTPTRRVSYGPLFARPTRPLDIAKWFAGLPGYLFPYNALYFVVAAVAYVATTPDWSTMTRFAPGWIVWLLVRNLLVTVAWYGLFHYRLYVRRSQDARFKYNARWPRESDRFTFGSQTRENVFFTLCLGVPMWTAYEVVTYWLFANGHIPWLSWAAHPVWIVVLFLLTPLFREVHFYAVHRLIHVPAIYKHVHALHHRNTNPGPWSGMSMHPLEHLVYFSSVILHWVVPSHPMHATFNLFHLAMSPVPGHSGFEKVEVGDSTLLDTNCLGHYLHHKYFEVNYADGAIPLDRWFGSFHDGSPEAHARMKERLASRNIPLD
jgi:sterol desaturase/sphingolipid hydroxylase (fatty acid hydroxylase superfamily)